MKNKDLTFINNPTDNQISLLDVLSEQNDILRNMYYGAVMVLNNTENPERFVFAAHGIRELIEKIPKYLNVSLVEHNSGITEYNLKQQVNELQNVWDKNVEKHKSFDGERWNGEIDAKLQRFLKKCQSFFSKYRVEKPTRATEMANFLCSLDNSGHSLPGNLQKRNVENLIDLRNFFQGVSHHTIPCTEEKFYIKLEQLEEFLLDRLLPRIFADFDVIDEIIKEGSIDG